MHLEGTINSNPYLTVGEARKIINDSRSSLFSHSAKVIAKTCYGVIGGGLIGNIPQLLEKFCHCPHYNATVEFLGESIVGTVESLGESFVQNVEHLLPSVVASQPLSIQLAGIGGTILFIFGFYRQRNLCAQANTAIGTLGDNLNRFITRSELENIKRHMPSYNSFRNIESRYRVADDKEIAKALKVLETSAHLDKVVQDILSAGSEEQMQQIYQEIKENVDDESIVKHFLHVHGSLEKADRKQLKLFAETNKLVEHAETIINKVRETFKPQKAAEVI